MMVQRSKGSANENPLLIDIIEDVEITDPRVLEKIANTRTECEREFSRDKWGYRKDRMPNRGDKEAVLLKEYTGEELLQIYRENQGSISHEFENKGVVGFTPNPQLQIVCERKY